MNVKAEMKGDSVRFDFDGTSWEARLTPSAFIELEDDGLGDVNTLVMSIEEKPSFRTYVKILTAALRVTKDDIAFTDVLAMANSMGSEPTVELVAQVIAASFPKVVAGSAGGKGKPPPTEA